MPKILSKYALREILAPMLIALFALSFIIFLSVEVPGRDEHLLLLLMRMFLRDDIDKMDVVRTFFLALPTTIMFILPMALLIGIIIGIGRMTLDLETRAMQTGGINIFYVFTPVLFLGAIFTAATAYLSYKPEPQMVAASVKTVARLLVSEFENLEPGQVYDELFDEGKGMNLYFDGRDEQSHKMQGVTLMLDRRAFEDEKEKEERKRERKRKIDEYEEMLEKGEITREQFDRLEYEERLKDKADAPIMIFAGEADFSADADSGRVGLNLFNGSIHMAGGIPDEPPKQAESDAQQESEDLGVSATVKSEGAPAPQERDYAVLKFGKFSKTESIGAPTDNKNLRMMTMPELRAQYNDLSQKTSARFRAKATFWERLSMSLESFIFAFIGLPLAVRVRPTGKSIGIVLAFALILVYHWLMRTGYSLIEVDSPFGLAVIFSPNLLFAAIGCFLWWRVIRR